MMIYYGHDHGRTKQRNVDVDIVRVRWIDEEA